MTFPNTTTLHQQYSCHYFIGVKEKKWNLESFRPLKADWGWNAYDHRCN